MRAIVAVSSDMCAIVDACTTACAATYRYFAPDYSSSAERTALTRMLSAVIGAAEDSGLTPVLLPGGESEAGDSDDLAVGRAAAVLADSPRAVPAAEEGTVSLGCWDGSEEELKRLRDAGFRALLLEDACGGDVACGIGRCGALVRLARSNRSSKWSGSMFGATSDDVPPPSVRNPRMWAQSKRQAREIMHESAASRGLPPPKLKK